MTTDMGMFGPGSTLRRWAKGGRGGGPEPPVAVDDEAFLPASQRHRPLKITPLGNDIASDAPIDPRSLTVLAGPEHGTLEVRGKKLLYRADPGFSGTDLFTYVVADRDGDLSAPATVRIEVEAVAPPTARDDVFDVRPKKPGKPVKLDVLANDEPGTFKLDPKSIEIVDGPDHGTLDIKGGKILYVPEPGYAGPDRFSYTVAGKDGSRSDPADVTLDVAASGGGGFTTTVPIPVQEVHGGRHVAPTNTLLLGSAANETMVVNQAGSDLFYLAGLGGNDVYALDALPLMTVIHDTGGRDELRFPSRFASSLGVIEIGRHLLLVDLDTSGVVMVVDWRGSGRIETWDFGRTGTYSHGQLVDALEEGRGIYFWSFSSWEEAFTEAGINPDEVFGVSWRESWDVLSTLIDDVDAYARSGRSKAATAAAGEDPAAGAIPAVSVESAAAALASLLHEQPEAPPV